MADIIDAFEVGSDPDRLEVVRLGANPTLLMFFTREAEAARMHWEDDPTVRSYVPCPGNRCPLCYAHEAPTDFQLLPALEVEKKKVGVLMVSMARGPSSLAAQLLPHLRDQQVQDKLVLVSRDRSDYSVDVRPLGERADRCLGVIQAFVKARDAGLGLLTAFRTFSVVELAEVPRVRAKLDALGGWTPPEP